MNNENQNINELTANKMQEEQVDVDTNEQISQDPQNNSKTNKANKNRLIILGITLIVILVIAISVILINKNNQKLEEDNHSTETNNDNYEDDNNINDDSSVNEEQDDDLYDEEDEYDGYSIEEVDNSYYLMRNNKKIAKLEEDNKFKLYKDESDKNSKYIAIYNLELAAIDQNNNMYAFLNIFKDTYTTSILYNINNGKYKIFEGNIAFLYDIPNYYIIEGRHNRLLVDASKMEVVSNEDFDVITDVEPLGAAGFYYTASNKYIVVRRESKDKDLYGLIDFNGNTLVEPSYEALVTTSNDNVVLAQKGNKFGAINSNNKIVIDFEYDGIDYIDGYFVVSKNNKLGVIDKDKKEIVPFNIDLEYILGYILREPAGYSGPIRDFHVFQKEDEIIIGYFPKGTKSKDESEEYEYDYLVIYKDGSYKIFDDYEFL